MEIDCQWVCRYTCTNSAEGSTGSGIQIWKETISTHKRIIVCPAAVGEDTAEKLSTSQVKCHWEPMASSKHRSHSLEDMTPGLLLVPLGERERPVCFLGWRELILSLQLRFMRTSKLNRRTQATINSMRVATFSRTLVMSQGNWNLALYHIPSQPQGLLQSSRVSYFVNSHKTLQDITSWKPSS